MQKVRRYYLKFRLLIELLITDRSFTVLFTIFKFIYLALEDGSPMFWQIIFHHTC